MISVVIGTYNQADILPRVLASYENQTLDKAEFDVILVDSSSTDSTPDAVIPFKQRFNLNYVRIPNQGKAVARNTGVGHATGQWTLITDADMIADPKLLETHLKAHQDALVPTCFEGAAFNLPDLSWPPNPDTLTPQVGQRYPNGKRLGWWYFLTGNLSLPKSLFEQMGGFSSDFLGYGWEDLELGYRLSKAKVPLLYLNTAINYHYHIVSRENELARQIEKGKSAKVFLAKHPELKLFLGLNPVSIWVFRHLSKESWLYQKMDQWRQKKIGLKKRLGHWFVSEYHYLTGILS